jgi:hypothetical protein
MALTLADHAIQHDNLFAQGVVKMFEEESPIMRWLNFQAINGDAYKYRIEEAMPAVQYRAVNEDYAESTGTISSRVAQLYLLGGETFMDNFLLRTQGRGNGAFDHERTQWEMKSRALGREISRTFLEGDNLADPDEPAGLRQVLPTGQVYLAGTNGAPLTTAMMDEALDLVIPGNVHIFMNALNRRKLTAAMLAGGSAATYQITYGNVDAMGEQTVRYGGAPIHIIRDRGTGTGILGFDETCGTSTITSSVYIVNFDADSVFGIFNGDGPPVSVRDLGEDQDSPGKRGRIEFFWNYVMKHPRGAARIRGLTAA